MLALALEGEPVVLHLSELGGIGISALLETGTTNVGTLPIEVGDLAHFFTFKH
jgi:hypothetical protein